MISETL